MLELQEKVTEKAKGSKLFFLIFYALGTLTHVPQNFYITANDYWMYKFRNPDQEAFNSSSNAVKTTLQANFSSSYVIVSNISSVSCLALTFLTMKKFSIRQRIVGSLWAMLCLFIITLIFVWIDTDSWQNEFFYISLLIGGLLHGLGSCFMISVFQLSITLPPIYLGSLLSGQSICGILVSLVQICTLAMGTTSKVNAFIYFSVGAIFVLIVEVLYLTMVVRADYFNTELKSNQIAESKKKIDKSDIKNVAKKLAPILLTMVLTTGSSVMMHPGVTSLIESVGKGSGKWSDIFFVPFCTFFLFNTFDFIGRECSIRWNWIGGTYAMLTVAIFRLLFLPMLLLCNIQPRKHLPVIFDEDYAYIILIILFATTTGYLVNLCISQITSVCTVEEKRIALFLTVLVMLVGSVSCSFLSSVIVRLI